MKAVLAAVGGIIVAAVAVWGVWTWMQGNEAPVEEVVIEEETEETREPVNQFLQLAPSGELEDEELPIGGDVTAIEESELDEPTTIEITDTGFVPEEVTVLVGSTVRFVNNGQAAHWPASDVHPTHDILPEFDAKRGLTTGETYEYTFSEAGEWSMHDHLFPQFTGTIVVE